MSTPTVSDYLKYVNLQMAAEAFLVYESGDDKGKVKADIKTALIDGNGHASRFTETQATTALKGSASHSFWIRHATSPTH